MRQIPKNFGTVIIVIAVIVSLGIATLYSTGRLSIISIDEMTLQEYSISSDGKRIEMGWWVATAIVDSPDEIAFVMKDFTQDLPEEGTGVEAKTTSEIAITMSPAGSAYFAGAVGKGRFYYNDSRWRGTERRFQWYIIPAWTSKHVPYSISATKDGQLIGEDIYSVGFKSGWDVTNIEIGSGDEMIKVRNLGDISRGLTQPREDIAIFYSIEGTPIACRESDLIAQLEDYAAGWSGTINTYEKFWNDRDLDRITSHPEWIEALFGTQEAVPSDITSLAGATTLDMVLEKNHGYAGSVSGSFAPTRTSIYTALYNVTKGSVYAFISLRGSASVFDTVIWRPPFGRPEITGIQAIGGESGQQGRIIVSFKNVGETADTFEGGIRFVTQGISVIQPAGAIVVDKAGTGTLTWTVATGDSEIDKTFAGVATVTSMGGNLADSEPFSITFTASQNGTSDTGSILGIVSKEDGNPIAGASVIPDAGTFTITDTQGRLVLTGIPVGERTVHIEAEGYHVRDVKVSVSKNSTSNMGNVVLTKGDGGIPVWVYLAIGILMFIGAIYYLSVRGKQRP